MLYYVARWLKGPTVVVGLGWKKDNIDILDSIVKAKLEFPGPVIVGGDFNNAAPTTKLLPPICLHTNRRIVSLTACLPL